LTKLGLGLALLLLLVVGMALAPFEIPCTRGLPGRIAPLREWSLSGAADDRLVAALRDNRTGRVQSLTVHTFSRGDHLNFSLHPALNLRNSVSMGDTVGWLISAELEERLEELRAELASTEALLQAERAARKAPIVDQVRQQLAHAETRVEQQQQRYERRQKLFATGMVPAEELEEEENLLSLYSIQAEIARAELQGALSGASAENVERVQVDIDGLHRRLDLLEERLRVQTLTAPLAGSLSSFFSADTLLVIRDTTAYVARLAVAWREREEIFPGQQLELHLPGGDRVLNGTVELLDDQLYALNGKQMRIGVATVEAEDVRLTPGLAVRCTVALPPVSPVEYLRRFLAGN
jgi:hypothetical protein